MGHYIGSFLILMRPINKNDPASRDKLANAYDAIVVEDINMRDMIQSLNLGNS